MENLRDFTESEAELSALNAEDNGSQNAKSSTLPPFWETNTGYEYPPIAGKKNTTNLVGDQNPTPENSDKSLRFEPTEYKNEPLEARKDLVFSKEVAEKTRQEIPPQASYLTFEPTEYKETQLEEKKFDFSCFDKPAEDKNEEIPPALMPFFELADMLEKEKQPFNTEKTALSIEKAADKTDGNPYAEYLGKGGTIYVHVFDVEKHKEWPTNIVNKNKAQETPTKAHYLLAEKIMNKKFKEDLKINLTVKVVFAKKGEKPMTKEAFQKRKDYKPADSYILIGEMKNLNTWQKQELHDSGWTQIEVSSGNLGCSASNQFYSWLLVDQFCSFGHTMEYQNAIGELDSDGNTITPTTALAMAIATAIEHEVGHAKFDLHLLDNAPFDKSKGNNVGLGGHVTKTIMQTSPRYKSADQYDEYMIAILEVLHGKIGADHNIELKDWTNFFLTWAYESLSNKTTSAWEYIKKSIADKDLEIIFSNRTDLPKLK